MGRFKKIEKKNNIGRYPEMKKFRQNMGVAPTTVSAPLREGGDWNPLILGGTIELEFNENQRV